MFERKSCGLVCWFFGEFSKSVGLLIQSENRVEVSINIGIVASKKAGRQNRRRRMLCDRRRKRRRLCRRRRQRIFDYGFRGLPGKEDEGIESGYFGL